MEIVSEIEQYKKKLAREIQRHEDFKNGKTVISKETFLHFASKYCLSGTFVIDSANENIVVEILLYLNKDERFNGDLNKGICLSGDKGTGKSVIMKAVAKIQGCALDNISSLPGYFSQKDIGHSMFEPLKKRFRNNDSGQQIPNHRIGNDLGREVDSAQYMGNYEDVGARYIYERYELFQDFKVLTHFTTNYENKESFIDRYKELNYDRIKEMCNFIFLNGKSRR